MVELEKKQLGRETTEAEGMKGGGKEGKRKLQAHYVQGEWQVTYFATLVIMCHAKANARV